MGTVLEEVLAGVLADVTEALDDDGLATNTGGQANALYFRTRRVCVNGEVW